MVDFGELFGDLFRTSLLDRLWAPFWSSCGSLWAPFGLPLAPFWLPFGSLWLPLVSFGLPLGSLVLPLGDPLAPIGSILASFGSLCYPRAFIFSLLMPRGSIFVHFPINCQKNTLNYLPFQVFSCELLLARPGVAQAT